MVVSLTNRERQVIELVGKGMINKQIAVTLNISSYTVQSYLKTAFKKNNLKNRSEAAVWLYRKERDGESMGISP